MFLALTIVLSLLCILINADKETPREISVAYNSKTQSYDILNKVDKSFADAYGYYHNNYNNSGWNYLDVFMQEEVDSADEHFTYSKSMGVVEVFIEFHLKKINT